MRISERLASIVRNWDDIVVVGHYDADGITSTAILVSALQRLEKEVQFINLKQLYSDDIEKIQNMGDHFIFADLGVGQLPFLIELMEKPFVILDHHKMPTSVEYPFLLHPEHAGLDGARDISGAGVSYLLARALGDNKDLAYLAVVGAVGDLQAREGALTGANREILRDAIASGKIFAYRDLSLYGRVSRPIPYMLLFSTDPILPGLTASEENVFRFLESTDIEIVRDGEWIRYVDLSQDEKRRFFTSLVYYLMRQGWKEEKALKLIGEVYDIVDEPLHSPLREVREFATLLNACGRHGHPEIGVHVAMGDRGKWYSASLSLLVKHREAIRRGIEWVTERGVDVGENIYFFHAQNNIPAPIVGIVAGMVYGSGIIPPDRPIIAMAYDGDFVKVSARATSSLVRRGVNLAEAMREAASVVGGEAGGHRPAAGARIPKGSEEEFLEAIDRIIGKQLKIT